jgi:hypothetical protein
VTVRSPKDKRGKDIAINYVWISHPLLSISCPRPSQELGNLLDASGCPKYKRCKEQTVDVAFDNGTLDAMIYGSPWYPPDNVVDNTRMYMNEIASSHDSVALLPTDCHRYFECWKMTAYFEADLNNVLIWCHSRLSRFEQFIPVTVAARF